MNVEEQATSITEPIPGWMSGTMARPICTTPLMAPTTLKEAGRESIPARLSHDSTSSNRYNPLG